jgi:hypothetical protein
MTLVNFLFLYLYTLSVRVLLLIHRTKYKVSQKFFRIAWLLIELNQLIFFQMKGESIEFLFVRTNFKYCWKLLPLTKINKFSSFFVRYYGFLWIQYLEKKPFFLAEFFGHSNGLKSYLWAKFQMKIRLLNILIKTMPVVKDPAKRP